MHDCRKSVFSVVIGMLSRGALRFGGFVRDFFGTPVLYEMIM